MVFAVEGENCFLFRMFFLLPPALSSPGLVGPRLETAVASGVGADGSEDVDEIVPAEPLVVDTGALAESDSSWGS